VWIERARASVRVRGARLITHLLAQGKKVGITAQMDQARRPLAERTCKRVERSTTSSKLRPMDAHQKPQRARAAREPQRR